MSRKGAAKNEIKVGRGLSFLFSLLKMDPGLTSLRFPLPVCHQATVCVWDGPGADTVCRQGAQDSSTSSSVVFEGR